MQTAYLEQEFMLWDFCVKKNSTKEVWIIANDLQYQNKALNFTSCFSKYPSSMSAKIPQKSQQIFSLNANTKLRARH